MGCFEAFFGVGPVFENEALLSVLRFFSRHTSHERFVKLILLTVSIQLLIQLFHNLCFLGAILEVHFRLQRNIISLVFIVLSREFDHWLKNKFLFVYRKIQLLVLVDLRQHCVLVQLGQGDLVGLTAFCKPLWNDFVTFQNSVKLI